MCLRLYMPYRIDDFRNDVINRQEYYVIPDMLAKGVGRSVSIIANEQRMDSARAILQLQASASEEELLATLQRLTVQRLKFLCKESAVKSSGIKAEIIGRLVTSWKKLCDVQIECAGDEQQGANSILRRIMGYTKMTGTPLAIQWGKAKETVARDAYVAKMRSLGHKGLHCQMTGLTLLPCHSYLGASSDGLILNHRYHEDKGVLEIKCPYSIEKNPTYNLPLMDIARTYSQQFFLEEIENPPKLKRSSNYYYQV